MSTLKKILLSIAILLCTFAGLWHFWIAGHLLALPDDFSYRAELLSVDNFYDKSTRTYMGQSYSDALFEYKTLSSTKVGNVIESTFKVSNSSDQEIISIKREYGIDPLTGAHVGDLGDQNREGYLFAPKNLEPGQSFTYWHVNYNGPAKMSYVGRETVEGLQVFLYETHYQNTVIDQTDDLGSLDGVPEQWGIILEPYLKLWIEPVSGTLINFEDETTAYYYDIETKEKLNPWNHFSNTFSEETVDQKIADAKSAKINTFIVQTLIPILLLGLAVVMVLLYFYKKDSEKKEDFGVHWLIHVFFVAFPITLIIVCWYLVDASVNKGNELRFKTRIVEIEDAILRRSDVAVSALEGLQGLFHASEVVNRTEWKAYISQLNLEAKYPGIKAVGYSPIILDADKEAHILTVQKEGFEDYDIHPEGIRESYAPVLYMEPDTERNLSLMGFDSFTNEVRNKTMDFARDTGNSSLSDKLIFPPFSEVDEQNGTASVLFIPIYGKDLPLATLQDRRSAITGYAFASFWIDEFINGLFGATPLGVNFKIYDGTELNEDTLLYEYYNDPTDKEYDSFRTATETIIIAEHVWTLTFEGLDEFRASPMQRWLTSGLIWLAIILCGLHIFVYFSLVSSRAQAMEWIYRFGRRFKGSKRRTLKDRKQR